MKHILFIVCLFILTTGATQSSARMEAMKLLQDGDVKRHFGNWEDALELYTNAINTDRGLATAYMKRARLYQEMGQFKNSIDDYNQAIAINPLSEIAYDQRAAVKVLSNDYIGAIKDVEEALKLNPSSSTLRAKLIDDYLLVKDFKQAMQVIDSLSYPDSLKEMFDYKKVMVLTEEGKLKKAENLLADLLSKNPEGTGYNLLGIIKMKQGDLENASNYFGKAIEMNKELDIAYYNKALVEHKLGNTNLAQGLLDSALFINAKNENIYFRRAIFKKEAGDYPGALKDYNAAIMIDSNYKYAIYNRIYTKKMLGNYSEALIEIEDLIEEDNTQPEFWNLKGSIHVLFGEHFKAVEAFTEAISLDGNYAEAYHNRGIAYVMSYRPVQGCQDLQYAFNFLNYTKSEEVMDAFCGF